MLEPKHQASSTLSYTSVHLENLVTPGQANQLTATYLSGHHLSRGRGKARQGLRPRGVQRPRHDVDAHDARRHADDPQLLPRHQRPKTPLRLRHQDGQRGPGHRADAHAALAVLRPAREMSGGEGAGGRRPHARVARGRGLGLRERLRARHAHGVRGRIVPVRGARRAARGRRTRCCGSTPSRAWSAR